MKVPFNDLQRHFAPLREELLAAVDEVVARGRFVLGQQVDAFEREFAEFLSVRHCIGVANGTDALELALRSVGVAAGSTVACAANAGGYATAAILAIGARPRYVDVDPDDANLSPRELERAFAGEAIAAVVATHLYGRMARVDELSRLCRASDVPLVEDCAQAHGARFAGRAAGTWGDVAAFSFYPTKNLGALGDGGAVVTTNDEVAATVQRLRQYGWSQRYRVEQAGGRNSRLDELQAAFLRRLLPRLAGWNDRRRAIATQLGAGLAGTALVALAAPGESSVAHLYVIRIAERDAVRAALAELGIQAEVHYPTPDHRQPAHPREISLPATEELCRTVLSLPCFPEMTNEEVDATIGAVRRVIDSGMGGRR